MKGDKYFKICQKPEVSFVIVNCHLTFFNTREIVKK